MEKCLPFLCGRVENPPLPVHTLAEPELAALAARKSWLSGGGEIALADLRAEDPGYSGAAFVDEYRQTKR